MEVYSMRKERTGGAEPLRSLHYVTRSLPRTEVQSSRLSGTLKEVEGAMNNECRRNVRMSNECRMNVECQMNSLSNECRMSNEFIVE